MIISDYNMPGGDGRQLLDEAAKDYPRAYRLLISGRPENLEGVTEHHCMDKPFVISQLKKHLDDAVTQAMKHQD